MERIILYVGFGSLSLFELGNGVGASKEKLADDDMKISIEKRAVEDIGSGLFNISNIDSIQTIRE